MAIIVKEGDHLKLTCAATAIPKPQISWSLLNGHAITDGAWKRMYYIYHYSVLESDQKKNYSRRHGTDLILESYLGKKWTPYFMQHFTNLNSPRTLPFSKNENIFY